MTEILIWSKGNSLPCEMLKEWIDEHEHYTVTFKDSDVESPPIDCGEIPPKYPILQYEEELVVGFQHIQDWFVIRDYLLRAIYNEEE